MILKLNAQGYVDSFAIGEGSMFEDMTDVLELPNYEDVYYFADNYMHFKVEEGVLVYDEAHAIAAQKASMEEAKRAEIQSQTDVLKAQLSSSDYKVIKCMEAQLAGEEMPYDIEAIHAERQVIRDKINELEQ